MLLTWHIECTRRKVRCDKQVPCSRCSRLRKSCSREFVYTTKTLGHGSARNEELRFLQDLLGRLTSETSLADARRRVADRIAALQDPITSQLENHTPIANSQSSASGRARLLPDTSLSSTPLAADVSANPSDATSINAIRTLESQVWCRQSSSCYPHRRECKCTFYMGYSELASITSDLGSSQLKWTYYQADASIFLTTSEARKVIEFHVEHLWWHHNALYSRTFLDQCEKFWASGIIVHPLWLALYLSILGVGGKGACSLLRLANMVLVHTLDFEK